MGKGDFVKTNGTQAVIYFLVVMGISIAAAGMPASEKGEKKFVLHGQVVEMDKNKNEVTVKHEDIPGLMPAMTMSFKVKDQKIWLDLHPGDRIVAEIDTTSDENGYLLENIRITEKGVARGAPTGILTRRLSIGEPIPNLVLTNQDGKMFRLSDFGGKALLVTFIYTRCPMPMFCPRLSSQFARIHSHLKNEPEAYRRTHLVTISFDPKYDTPSVLRKYGLAYLENDASGFSHWDFASTNASDLQKLANAFGLKYREEDKQITHTMVIALIGKDSTLVKYWSEDWTVSELEGALRAQAGLKKGGSVSPSEGKMF